LKDDTYRIRVGDYRVVYPVDDRQREGEVVAVGDRTDICQ
jgi:mRNA-degrading endonuclease RelE of RelBE toxin-antitoxin system